MSEEFEETEKVEPNDAQKIAAAYIAAWRDKEFDALRELLADDFSYVGPLVTLDDPDECRKSLERMAPVTTDLVVEGVFTSESDIVTWFTLHTRVALPTPVANWIHVEDGKINRIRAVYDPRALIVD